MTNESNVQEADLDFVPSSAEPTGKPFGETPLVDFWGTGAGYAVKSGTSRGRDGKPGRKWTRVEPHWKDVEVIESTDVYPFDTAEIGFFYTDPQVQAKRQENKGTSDWEVLSESIRKFYGNDPECFLKLFGSRVFEGQDSQPTGMRMHMKLVDSLLNVGPDPEADNENDRTKWHDAIRPAWRVIEVQGLSGSSNGSGNQANTAMSTLMGIANGKSPEEFYMQVLQNQELMGSMANNPGLVEQLKNKTFVDMLKDLGRLKVENGVIKTD